MLVYLLSAGGMVGRECQGAGERAGRYKETRTETECEGEDLLRSYWDGTRSSLMSKQLQVRFIQR